MMHPCKRNCLVALHELLAVLLLVPVAAFAAHAQQSTGVPSSSAGDKPPYNIVFLIVDQRTYRLLAGSDYSLPALDSIARHGVTFQNHYISSAMCSPSRASFLTGQPPQVNGVIDQMEYAFQQSLSPNLTAPGMPDALLEYQKGWDAWSGVIPTDRKDMWSIFYNYYLNTIQDNDRSLQEIVDTLNDMDFWRDTVVIFTADHGEMGGTHGGLKGKGPFPYEENAHVPLIIAHPAGKAGATSSAITSHLDLLPTFVGLTGLPDAKRPQAVKALPGRDFSALLADPEKASITAVRPAVLFNYVGPATVDGDYLGTIMSNLFLRKPSPPLSQANLKKRGFLQKSLAENDRDERSFGCISRRAGRPLTGRLRGPCAALASTRGGEAG